MQTYSMNVVAFRLSPDADLKQSLLDYCAEHGIDAACVISCVGSLRCASVRFAGRIEGTMLEKKMEIVSLEGTVSRDGSHLHIALADEDGRIVGGHLMKDARVHTTAEIVLGIISDMSFKREPDLKTGYKELKIEYKQ